MKEERIKDAAERFEELERTRQLAPRFRQMYISLNRTFQLSLHQCTSHTHSTLVGTFAKTDYLLKEHHASAELRQAVNAARKRLELLRERNREKQLELERIFQENFEQDLRAIAFFVSLVYEAEMPETLRAALPLLRTSSSDHRLLGDCMRFIVERWDDDNVYGLLDNGSDNEARVCYSQNRSYEGDWTYLQELFYPGAQLNLVRPRTDEEGTIFPELIIFMPDYLVDISTIAACFESYGESPVIHLLNKLRPAPSTDAIILGNLASQFLDEELHHRQISYKESLLHFFRQNALSLLTTPLPDDFHQQAQKQRQHIRRAIQTDLPADIGSFRPENVMVEPSFFSEMLGVQGRMDFLQLDHRLLIEQKSGKCGFPQRDPDTPTQLEKHYVQMLLYMLLLRYNYREQYEANHRELHAFLLYSRYANSLLSLSWAPHLIFRAIRLRNRIAWSELQYAQGKLDFLTTLTPDQLNTHHTQSTLWTRYQRPALQELLSPIQKASPLLQAYFLRMLQFLECEHMLSKVGNQTKENAGFASIWQASLDDKLQSGDILIGKWKGTDPSPALPQGEEVVTLSIWNQLKALDTPLPCGGAGGGSSSTFRIGDIVILYPFDPDTEPDARKTMVLRGSIDTITATDVTISLRNEQVDRQIFLRHAEDEWAVEHDFYESSFSSLYRGLYAFLTAPAQRQDLLLFQREPVIDTNRQLLGDYGAFNPLVLRTQQARDLFLIIGPPGTGKTSFGMLYTLQEELLHHDTSVLILSYTNRAVDEICSKLVEVGIDFLRIGNRLSCNPAYRPYLLEERSFSNVQQLQQIIAETRVLVGTTTAFSSHVELLQVKPFTLAIIDEASQILEPHLLGIFSTLSEGARFVLIGDHKQLPAVVQQREEQSATDHPLLHDILLTNCRLSLFERLLRRYRHNPAVTFMLTRQGRMHPAIADFPNHAFYNNALQPVPLPHQQETLADNEQPRMAFYAVSYDPRLHQEQEVLSDKVNLAEANFIARLAVAICQQEGENFNPDRTLGIIVPYRHQIAAIRQAVDALLSPSPDAPVTNNCSQFLRRHDVAASVHDASTTLHSSLFTLHSSLFTHHSPLTIDTVERFQGSQRDYIIYGFTVSHRYQLDFLASNTFEEDGRLIDRKLNVAMTRARRHLFMVGNPAILSQNPVFNHLINYCQTQNCYHVVSEE